MRNIPKSQPPRVLVDSRLEWEAAVGANPSEHNKNRYRHEEIKAALIKETASKCVYCESRIGHNCPGDIEHKIPKSERLDLIFDWFNMTIACNECNRRKRDYYKETCMFLDPNRDDVEAMTIHIGPIVFSTPGNTRSENTLKLLQVDRPDRRPALIAQKWEKLEAVRNLVERIASIKEPTLKQCLIAELGEDCQREAEYSAMIKAYVERLPANWANQ